MRLQTLAFLTQKYYMDIEGHRVMSAMPQVLVWSNTEWKRGWPHTQFNTQQFRRARKTLFHHPLSSRLTCFVSPPRPAVKQCHIHFASWDLTRGQCKLKWHYFHYRRGNSAPWFSGEADKPPLGRRQHSAESLKNNTEAENSWQHTSLRLMRRYPSL